MTPPRPSLRPVFGWLVAGVAAVILSVAYVDRPVSTWAHAAGQGIALFRWLLWPVDTVTVMAVAGLPVAALAAARGWRPGSAGKTAIAAGVATAVAIMMKDEAKWFFGRTWPETWITGAPSWIGDGAFGFHFFRSQEGYWSFPSGHMTVVTAAMGVLWRCVPRGRWAWAAVIASVAVGLVGADFHFISDILAGTGLGAACAAGTLAFIDCSCPNQAPRPPPKNSA